VIPEAQPTPDDVVEVAVRIHHKLDGQVYRLANRRQQQRFAQDHRYQDFKAGG
jgi:cobalamin biosynthesis protein CobT